MAKPTATFAPFVRDTAPIELACRSLDRSTPLATPAFHGKAVALKTSSKTPGSDDKNYFRERAVARLHLHAKRERRQRLSRVSNVVPSMRLASGRRCACALVAYKLRQVVSMREPGRV